MNYNLVENIYTDKDINDMITTLQSDRLTMGNKVKEFETKFSEKFNFNYSVMVNSGSSANLLAFSVLCNPKRKHYLKKGSRILVPSVCWSTSVYPIIQNGMIPIFMDVNPETLNINAEDINNFENIQGIVLVHILGNSTNMEKIMKIVNEKNLIVMEDTCESLSSKFKSTYLGGFGDMGTYSFYYSHHMTTIEGGMITCKTEEDYQLLLCLRSHGWNRNQTNKKQYEFINNKYCFINFGYNLRPTEIQGAMGLNQLNDLDQRNKIRKINYKNITNKLLHHNRNYNIFTVAKKTDGCDVAWFAIAIFLSNKYIKYLNDFLKYLDSNKIENRPIVTGNFTRQPVMELIDPEIDPKRFKGADKIHFNGFYIGCHTNRIYSNSEIDDLLKIFFSYKHFNYKIPFFDSPYNLEKSLPYVIDSIKSTWISIGGKYIEECEKKLQKIVGCKYIILTLTGTAAIHCMVKCLKYRYPDCKKIYIPNNTYIACINILLQEYDISMIECVDVDIHTLNITNVSHLDKNAALFVIHNIAGITNIPKIKRERPDLIIFEDNSEGFLGKYEHFPTGSKSIASTLSFNMNKNCTSGQGGAFCTNDKELYDYIFSFTRQGFTNIDSMTREYKKFHYKMIGHNYRMTNMTAAVLLSQIEQIDDILKTKQKVYNIYKSNLNNSNLILQKIDNEIEQSYWNIVIRIKDNTSYKYIEKKLDEYFIETRPMFLPIQKFKHLCNIKCTENTNSFKIHNEYIFIPCNNIKEHNIKYICNILQNIKLEHYYSYPYEASK